MKKFIVYGLFCPFTDNLHYIGKSSSYMTRPQQHLTKSHSDKINEWVTHLKMYGYSPIIKIFADCDDENQLQELEKQYISNAIKDGCFLLNEQQNSTTHIMRQRKPPLNDNYIIDVNTSISDLGKYLKIIRIYSDLTQQQLSEKCGVSLGTIKNLSQGNNTIGIDKLCKILDVLDFEISIQKKNLSFTEVFVEPQTPDIIIPYRKRVRNKNVAIKG